MLLIGSRALEYYISLNRKPKDIDVICSYVEYDNWLKKQQNIISCYPIDDAKKIIVKTNLAIFEFEISWESSTAKKLLELIVNDQLNRYSIYHIPSLDVLYAIKMSHRFLKNSPHFLKTMNDILMMRKLGVKIPDYLKEWFVQREKETYNYSHPNLNQLKKNFFNPNQSIKYVYDHDSIHEAMKHLDKPAYSFFKEDEKEVKCSKKKFYEVSEEIRLYSVLEESYVLALERSQIPFKNKIDPKESFLIALKKVCTSISSGWWREFAWDHYYQVLEMYNDRYVSKFWDAVNNNKVKKYENDFTGTY